MESNSGVESMPGGGKEKIFSIMLSTSELAKLDLSNIQLFQANKDFTQNGLNDNEKEVGPLYLTRQDSFSFHLDAGEEVSTASDLPVPVQVLKSRGVIEAEKSMIKQNRGNNSCCRKQLSVSMDETSLDRFESRRVAETKKIKKAQDDSAVHGTLRPPLLPIKTSQAEEDPAEAEEIMRIKLSIDLKSSPASKFLVQLMPWELQPSPVTPFTPAAVPFKWEEVPGKPKTLQDANRLPPQLNSFLVLHPPPRLLVPPSTAKKLLARGKRSRRKWIVRKLRRPARFFRAFFKAVWRAVSLRKSRHRKRGNIKLSYESLDC